MIYILRKFPRLVCYSYNVFLSLLFSLYLFLNLDTKKAEMAGKA